MSNEPKIRDRIHILMQELALEAVSDLEKGPNWNPREPEKRLISNGLISDWGDKSIEWSSDKLEKFLTGWNVNRDWWKTGEGAVLNKKPTSVQERSDNKELALGEPWEATAFRKIIEGGAEYVLVHKTAFENHRFTSVEQIEANARELAEARAEVQRLVRDFIEFVKDTRGLGSLPELPKVQEAKKGTAV